MRARRVALEGLRRIRDGAYANLALPAILDRSDLDERDRHFVTELVYGTTRMQRACDFVIDQFATGDVDPAVRDLLRLGAYQLAFLGTPAHAAVGETVEEAPKRAKGFANAVLRRVAELVARGIEWPDDATRLSYPDWIVDRLIADRGHDDAIGALEQMNETPTVHQRDDGYIQDPASEAVAAYLGPQPGERIAELCAAPGGKATALAHAMPGVVVALDVQHHRTQLVVANARTTKVDAVVTPVTGDGTCAPLRPASFDRVLVDAPCSGLGVLRRRPDARWRIGASDVDDLVRLQRALLGEAATLVRDGGVLVYSVCTLTAAEAEGNDDWLASTMPAFRAIDPPGHPWRPSGRGGLLLPQEEGTDGMYVVGLQRSGR